jgi:hypothetical protein
MVAAFSTVAGGVASELEDRAAQGRLDAARSLVDQLETMGPELLRLASELSLNTLRDQATQWQPAVQYNPSPYGGGASGK